MMHRLHTGILGVLLLSSSGLGTLHADACHDAWLRYMALDGTAQAKYESLPGSLVILGDSALLSSAQREVMRGVLGMTGKPLRAGRSVREKAIVLGTLAAIQGITPGFAPPDPLAADGFWLVTAQVGGFDCLIVTSPSERGVLYGVFAFLRRVARGESVSVLNELQQPYAPIRWVDQWDNLDGTIERGYAGPSIFFEKGGVRGDLTRAMEYARLLASIGITGCTLNNVNANPRIIDDSFFPQLARIADVFRPWGVRLAVSVDLGSPKVLGNLDSFDPWDPRVIQWWKTKVDKIYQQIPDFGGFVVKADSEGRSGPSSYGRTPADAANTLARALKPHGGILFYRAFVYDHHSIGAIRRMTAPAPPTTFSIPSTETLRTTSSSRSSTAPSTSRHASLCRRLLADWRKVTKELSCKLRRSIPGSSGTWFFFRPCGRQSWTLTCA